MIIDNVRYHHATLHKDWRDSIEPEFKLEFLPPYSPDMNPIERFWQYLKGHGMAGYLTDDGDALTDKLCETIQELLDQQLHFGWNPAIF